MLADSFLMILLRCFRMMMVTTAPSYVNSSLPIVYRRLVTTSSTIDQNIVAESNFNTQKTFKVAIDKSHRETLHV